jgi:hypothetical protein
MIESERRDRVRCTACLLHPAVVVARRTHPRPRHRRQHRHLQCCSRSCACPTALSRRAPSRRFVGEHAPLQISADRFLPELPRLAARGAIISGFRLEKRYRSIPWSRSGTNDRKREEEWCSGYSAPSAIRKSIPWSRHGTNDPLKRRYDSPGPASSAPRSSFTSAPNPLAGL